ncbi:MAG: A/G-specific adenine glycosylase [Pseudohongiellaceae bacterium]
MTSSNPQTEPFSDRLLIWHRQYGRHKLPWQRDPSPYRVWISEIMLQQTQVNTVIPYFERFMSSFPTIESLAAAQEDRILHLWTGLGYYARARNLHKAAKCVQQEYAGHMPNTVEALSALPGIGLSTAGAIVALGFRKRAVILDGNVKRVLCRYRCIPGWPDRPNVRKQLWALADSLTPADNCAAYTQAIMDLGATLCTRSKPTCPLCPLQDDCLAHNSSRSDEFPHRKPTKKLPVKTTYMLIFHNPLAGKVLLEKRPSQGIWGGLWSFPETGDISHLNDVLFHQVLNETRAARHWQPIRHTFSHFHLDITPVAITVNQDHISIMENDRLHWYDLNQPPELGLAAPVKKLLSSLQGRLL